MCIVKVNFESNNIPRYFLALVQLMFALNVELAEY